MSRRLAEYFTETRRNAIVVWTLVCVLGGTLLGGAYLDRYEPVLFGVVAIVIVVTPPAKFRNPFAVAPWYFVGLLCLPVLWEAFVPIPIATGIVSGLAVATMGLLIAVELDRFTSLRLEPWFAVALTVLFTLAMAGLFGILRWISDVLFGTTYLLDGRTQDAINAAVMIEFIYATIAGLVAGGLFYFYFRRRDRPAEPEAVLGPTRVDEQEDVEGVVLSDRLGVSVRRQRQLARAMQLLLVALFVYGLWSRQIAVVTNAALAIAITFIPPVLERDYQVTIEPGLVLWMTAAVFLHALGTAGLYDVLSTWDHLTHTLSATVVAAAGYASLRAIHLHASGVYLPKWAMFGFLLVFMLAMSVIWEILEFFVDQGALLFGMEPILAQHGIDDTIVDMIFNLIGSIIVAAWGTVYLVELSETLARVLEEQFESPTRSTR